MQIRTWAGIDVSAKTLAVCRWREGAIDEQEFRNDGDGHRELIKWLGKGARVGLEATGVYHLQLAVALRGAGVEVMVVNPRVAKDFVARCRTEARPTKWTREPCSSMCVAWSSVGGSRRVRRSWSFVSSEDA